MKPRPANAQGFTLIETLLALAVAATAASVILALVHSHYRRTETARAASEETIRLLNDRAWLDSANWRSGDLANDTAGLPRLAPPTGAPWPHLRVENVEISGVIPPPPMAAAHTPFQRFGIEHAGRALWFVAPALPPPAGS